MGTEERLEEVKFQNFQLQKSVSEMNDSISLANSKVREYEELVEENSNIIKELTLQKDSLIKSHEEEKQISKSVIEDYENQTYHLKQSEEDMKAYSEQSRLRIVELESNCREVNAAFENFKIQSNESAKNLSSQIEKLVKDLDNLQQVVRSLESENNSLVNELKDAKEKVNVLENDYVELNKSKSEAEELVQTMEEKENILSSLVENKKHEEDLMIKKMIEKDEKISSLMEKSQEMEERFNQFIQNNNSLANELKDEKEKVKVLELECVELRKSTSEADELVRSMEEKENILSSLVGSKENEEEMMLKKIKQKDEKISSLLENLQELEERLNQLDQNEDILGNLKETCLKHEQEIDLLKKHLEEKDLNFRKAIATAKKLKFQLQQAAKSKEDLDSEISILKSELEKKDANVRKDNPDTSDNEQHLMGFEELRLKVELYEQQIQDLEEKGRFIQDLKLEIAEYKSLLSSKEEEIAIMREDSRMKENNASSLQTKLLEKEKCLNDLETEKETLRTRYTTEIDRLTENILRIESQKSEMQLEIVTLEEQKISLRDELARKSEGLETFMVNAEQKSQEKEKIMNDMKVQLDILMNKTQEESSLEEMTQKQKELEARLTEKEMSLKEVEEQNTELSNLLQSLQQEIRNKSELANTLQDTLTSTEIEKGQLDELNQTIHKEINMLNEKVSSMSNSLAQKEDLLSRVTNFAKQHYQRIMRSECVAEDIEEIFLELHKYNDQESTSKNHTQDVEELEKSLASLEKQNKEEKEKVQNLEQSYNALLEENSTLTEQLTALKNDIQQGAVNRESWDDLVGQLTIANDERNDFMMQIQYLKTEQFKVVEENNSMKDINHKLSTENRTQFEQLKDITSRNNELESKLSEVNTNLQVMSEKVNLKESSMAHMNLTIASFSAENDKLKEENTRLISLSNEFEKAKREYEQKLEEILSENQFLLSKISSFTSASDNMSKQEIFTATATPTLTTDFTETEVLKQSEHLRKCGLDDINAQDELETAKERLKRMEEAQEKANEKLKLSETKCEKMLVKLKAFKTKCDKLQEEVNSLKMVTEETGNSQKAHAEDHLSRVQELEVMCSKKDESNYVLSCEIKEMKTKLSELESAKEIQHSIEEELKGKLKALQEELNKSFQELQQRDLKLSSTQEDILHFKNEISSLETFAENHKKKEMELLDIISELQSKLNDTEELKLLLETTKRKHEESERKLEDSLMLCDSLEVENKSYKDIIANLKENISKLEQERRNAEENQFERKTLLEKIEMLESERDQMQDEIDGYREDFNVLKAERNELKNKCESIHSKLKDSSDENNKLKEKIGALEWKVEEIESLEEELEEVRSDLDKKKLELDHIIRERDNFQSELEQIWNTGSKVEDIESLKLELEKISERNNKLEKELESSSKQKNAITSEVEHLKEKLKDAAEKVSMFDVLQQDHVKLKAEFDKKRDNDFNETESVSSKSTAEKIKELEEELELIKEELNETMSENENLRSKTQVSDYKAVLFDKLQSDYQALKSENESLKGNVAPETYADQNESVDTLKEKLNERETEIQQLKSKLSTMTIESSVKKEDVMHIRSTPSDLEKELNDKQDQIDSLLEELSELTTENDVINGEIAHLKIQNKMYDEVKKEFESLNYQNHKLLTENSKMVKTIEELHQKMLNVSNHDKSFLNEERDHVAREKETLLQNIKQLEKKCEELGQKNSNISQELLANEGQIQQLMFDNETMRAQLGIAKSGQIQMENFHGDYQRLQGQFSTAMDQKNKAQSELNQMAHRLQQRDARCQQLAMQVRKNQKNSILLNLF